MAISDKLNYLIETKSKFKDRLNSLGAEIIENTTFRNYLNWLDTFYGDVSDKTDLAKNGVVGRTSQDGNPTPENPVEIKNLSGDVEYRVRGQGISEIFPLSLKSRNLFNESLITSIDGTIKYIPINVKKNTDYTLSTNSGTPTSANVFLSTTNSGVTTNNNGAMIDQPRTINSADNNIMYVGYRNDLSPYWVQLEENSIPTDHEPYYDIELCNISDYKDRIYSQNGEFYLEKKTGKVVFDGSENWTINTSYTYNVFYRTLGNYARISNTQTTYCEYYKGIENTAGIVDFGNNYNNSIGVRTANDNIKDIYISNNSITSASDFKTWLSTHNTVVYYVLATPTTTEITQENYPTLYSQLLAIQEFLTKYKINKEFLLDYSSPEIEY